MCGTWDTGTHVPRVGMCTVGVRQFDGSPSTRRWVVLLTAHKVCRTLRRLFLYYFFAFLAFVGLTLLAFLAGLFLAGLTLLLLCPSSFPAPFLHNHVLRHSHAFLSWHLSPLSPSTYSLFFHLLLLTTAPCPHLNSQCRNQCPSRLILPGPACLNRHCKNID